MMITLRNRWLLRVFWGKRSRYPGSVGAAPGLWWAWFRRRPLAFFTRVYVTSGARRHGSRARRLGKHKRKFDGPTTQPGFPLSRVELARLTPEERKRLF